MLQFERVEPWSVGERVTRGYLPWLCASLAALLVSGCSTSSVPLVPDSVEGNVAIDVANATKGTVGADVENSSKSMHHFLVGQLEYLSEDFDAALKNFKEAGSLAQEPAPLVHLRLAELYLRFGNLDAALASAERAVGEEPQEPGALLLYAGILENLGRDNEAQPIYRSLIEKYPDKFDAYILLSNSYLKKREVERAVGVLQELLNKNPHEVLAHYYLGQAYEKAEKLDLAEKEYKFVVEADVQRGTGVADLLRVFLLQKKGEEAKRLCNDVLARNPSDILARKALGHLMLGESNFDAALEHLQVVEQVEEDSSETRFKIALIQIEKQNFKEAIRELNLVIAKNPKHYEARYYLASMYAGGGRRKEAVEQLEEIDQSSQIFVKSRTFLAFVLRQEQDFEGAEKAVRAALEREPQDSNILLYLVLVLRDQNRFNDAAKVLKSALNDQPDNEKFLFNLALVNHDLGKEIESLQLMERVIKVNPTHADALNYLAYSFAEKGRDFEKAHSYIQQALRVKPDDAFYLDTLGWIQFKLGQLNEAEATLARAVTASSEDIVIVEHYLAVLIAAKKFEVAATLMRSALDKSDPKDITDKEKAGARTRIEKLYSDMISQNPELLPKPHGLVPAHASDESVPAVQ